MIADALARASRLDFRPLGHGPYWVSFRAVVPQAGTVLGVRLPSGFPAPSTLLALHWDGGEDVVVPSNGAIPAETAGKLKFWTRGGTALVIRYGVPAAVRTAQLAGSGVAPHAILVRPAENGTARLESTWTQGAAG